ncbi:site-specific integrase [Methylobacterium brachythecii]|nr:site-specific integrase [Methylobacterium brachythecii]MBB3903591.1 integrase [Methylobacterium brachythecii]
MKRPGSSFHQFVQRIPADVIGKVRGMTLTIPVGETVVVRRISAATPDVRISLGTRDDNEAKHRHAVATGYLQGVWRAVREGPRRLTHKEAVALAGEAYSAWTEAFEDDPGPPEMWAQVTAHNVQADAGTFGRAAFFIGPDEGRRARSMEERFGRGADAVLARHGLIVDADSRARLIDQIGRAMLQAGEANFARADGDYSPDPAAVRFPKFDTVRSEPAKPAPSGVTIGDLLNKMSAERNHAPKTRSEWTRAVRSLTDHAKVTDPAALTTPMVVAWMDSLVTQGLKAKTINDVYLAAVKALFAWAEVRIGSNPVAKVPRIKRNDEESNERGYTLAEAETVLRAALLESNPARRWLPWLMAYSGARAGEIVQLRRQDIRQEPESGVWYLDFNPEAGRLKNKPSQRVVPLHPHLIEMGFVTWAKGQANERLFYRERAGGAPAGRRDPKSVTINRVGDWVRDDVAVAAVRAGEVAPNHGWRHRFSTELVNLEVPDTTRKRLTGHRLDGEDNRYVGKIVMERLHAAVAKLPRYVTDHVD